MITLQASYAPRANPKHLDRGASRAPRCAWILAIATTACSLLSGCGGSFDCTSDLQASVTVHVVDANGTAVTDAVVTYSRNGGAFGPAQCTDLVGSGTACKTWVADREEDGHFVVRAESADGMHTDEQAVQVFSDECHVEGKTVTLTL